MEKVKKVPIRKCVATGENFPKNDMFRIVRLATGGVIVDLTGKARGRGAYLSKSKKAIEKAKSKKILNKHLEVDVPEEVYQELFRLLGDVID